MSPPVTIGEAIRRERLRQGLTMAALGRRTGLDRRTILRLERGEILAANSLGWVLEALRVRLVVRLEPVTPSPLEST